MELLVPVSSQHQHRFILVDDYQPNWFMRLMGLKARMGRWELNPDKNGLGLAAGTCTIDFGLAPVRLNQMYPHPVLFGTVLYSGISPLKFLRNNVYECIVSNVQLVEKAPAWKETMYYM